MKSSNLQTLCLRTRRVEAQPNKREIARRGLQRPPAFLGIQADLDGSDRTIIREILRPSNFDRAVMCRQIQKDLLMHLSKNWEGFCGLTLEIEAQVWPFTAFPFCVWGVVEGGLREIMFLFQRRFTRSLWTSWAVVIGRGTTLPIYEEAESVSVRKMRKMRAQYSETHS